jgi:hypothetical protein
MVKGLSSHPRNLAKVLINDLEEKIAAEYFGDCTANWPRFFTTFRWVLGVGAERHLINISYSG